MLSIFVMYAQLVEILQICCIRQLLPMIIKKGYENNKLLYGAAALALQTVTDSLVATQLFTNASGVQQF